MTTEGVKAQAMRTEGEAPSPEDIAEFLRTVEEDFQAELEQAPGPVITQEELVRAFMEVGKGTSRTEPTT